MAVQTRTLTGGMNTDAVDDLLKEGEYRMAQNLQLLTDGADGVSGYLQAIRGNLKALTAAGFDDGLAWNCFGYAADETKNTLYLFVGIGAQQRIWKCTLNATGATPTVFLSSEWATDGGNLFGLFGEAGHIDAEVSGNVLRWTDGVSDPRTAALNYNWSAGFAPQDLLRIPAPPRLPAYVVSGTDNGKPASVLQDEGWRFAFRYTYRNGHQSVPGGWSGTNRPKQKWELQANAKTGNTLGIYLGDNYVWGTVKTVELIGWQPDTNAFYLLKRWDKDVAAEATQLSNHNNGTPNLQFLWDGITKMEALDRAAMGRPFDSVPLSAGALATIGGRDVLGDLKMGYNSPTDVGIISVGGNDELVQYGERQFMETYCIIVNQLDSNTWYFAYVVKGGGADEIYRITLPGFSGGFTGEGDIRVYSDCVTFKFKDGTTPLTPGSTYIAPPETVGRGALVRASNGWVWPYSTSTQESDDTKKGILAGMVAQANGISGLQPGGFVRILKAASSTGRPFYVQNEISNNGNTAFVPGTSVKVGLIYKDIASRTCGAVDLYTRPVPPFTTHLPNKKRAEFTNSISVYFPPGDQSAIIPDWAHSASVVVAPNNKMASCVEGITGYVRRFYYPEGGGAPITGQPENTTLKLAGYGLPTESLVATGQGYAFSAGDLCDLSSGWLGNFYPVINETVKVLGIYGGYVVVAPPADADLFFQTDREYSTWIPTVDLPIIPAYPSSPASAPPPAWVSSFFGLPGTYRSSNKNRISFRLYTPLEGDPAYYETGRATKINRDGAGNRSFDQSAVQVRGEWNLITNNTPSGNFVACSPKPRYDNSVSGINTDFSRIAPYDRVGQQRLPNAFAFSNPLLLSSAVGGGGTWDAGDLIELDAQAGGITSLVPLAQDSAAGGVLIALCTAGSFAVLIGRTEVQGADGVATYTARTNGYVGSVSPLQWGCQSRKGWTILDEVLYFVDGQQGQMIITDGRQTKPLAEDAIGASFRWLLVQHGEKGKEVRLGVHPASGSVFVTIGKAQMPNDLAGSVLIPTTSLTDDSTLRRQNQGVNLIYNARLKKWVGTYKREGSIALPDVWLQIAGRTFTWNREHGIFASTDPNDPGLPTYRKGRLWEEFAGLPGGLLCGFAQQQGLCVVMNGEPTAIKRFMAVSVDATLPPDDGYMQVADPAYPQITRPDLWEQRDSVWRAAVLRDRMSFSGTPDATAYEQAEMEGERMRGRSLRAWYIWNVSGGGGGVTIRSVGLKTEDSGNSSWT